MVQSDFPAQRTDPRSRGFPHLSRAALWIEKGGDQARFRLFPLSAAPTGQELPQGIDHCFPDGESFDPLRSPCRLDLTAWDAPDLFGIVLEERSVQFPSKPVDEEILKGIYLFQGKEAGIAIAHCESEESRWSEVTKRGERRRERIVEELSAEEDARQPCEDEHDVVCRPGIGAAGMGRSFGDSPKDPLPGRRCHQVIHLLEGKHGEPPGNDPAGFGKESVRAHIRPVSVMTDRACKSSDNIPRFENDGVEVRPRDQFIRSGQTCGACADDHDDLLFLQRWLSFRGIRERSGKPQAAKVRRRRANRKNGRRTAPITNPPACAHHATPPPAAEPTWLKVP